jgi:hypothetical protein
VNGKIEGTLNDLVASFRSDIPHPEIVAIVMEKSRGSSYYYSFL